MKHLAGYIDKARSYEDNDKFSKLLFLFLVKIITHWNFRKSNEKFRLLASRKKLFLLTKTHFFLSKNIGTC